MTEDKKYRMARTKEIETSKRRYDRPPMFQGRRSNFVLRFSSSCTGGYLALTFQVTLADGVMLAPV